MRKIPLSRSADVIDYALVRPILYVCGYGATRVGDHLKVYKNRTSTTLYVNPETAHQNNELVASLYCDEGFQSDCLRFDGTQGVNPAYIEMCDINAVLRLIVAKLDADRKYTSGGFIGRGKTARHYHTQYVEALDELLPGSELAVHLDWPAAKVEKEAC